MNRFARPVQSKSKVMPRDTRQAPAELSLLGGPLHRSASGWSQRGKTNTVLIGRPQ